MMKKILLQVLSVLCLAAPSNSETATPREVFANELGARHGAPITNGYVFIDGRYHEPPYVVSRKGRGIFLNDILVRVPVAWPIPDYAVPQEPALPANITENSTFEDLRNPDDRRNGYLARVMRYYHMNYSRKEATEKVVQAIGQIPFVTAIVLADDGFSAHVETNYGHKREMKVGVQGTESYLRPPPTKHEIIARVERLRAQLDRSLAKGTAAFLFTSGPQKAIPPELVPYQLPVLSRIMSSSKSIDEKLEELSELDMLNAYDCPRWRDFVRDFQVLPILEQRIAGFGNADDLYEKRKEEIMKRNELRERLDAEARQEAP